MKDKKVLNKKKLNQWCSHLFTLSWQFWHFSKNSNKISRQRLEKYPGWVLWAIVDLKTFKEAQAKSRHHHDFCCLNSTTFSYLSAIFVLHTLKESDSALAKSSDWLPWLMFSEISVAVPTFVNWTISVRCFDLNNCVHLAQ